MSRFTIALLSSLFLWLVAGVSPVQAQKLELMLEDKKTADFLARAGGLKMTDSGKVLVTSARNATLLVQNEQSFETVSLIPTIFKDKELSGIDQMQDGRLVLVNKGSGRIALTNETADKLIKRFSQSDDDAGELEEPQSIAVSVNKKLFIADRDNNRISVFNDQGLFLWHFGQHDGADSDLSKPTHIALDASENVYVLEAGELNRVSIFHSNGTLIKQLDTRSIQKQIGEVVDFSAMTADLNGLIYLADDNKKLIFIYDWKTDSILKKFGSLGQSRGQYRNIAFMSVNNKGQLAVLDKINKKVEVYQLETTDFKTPVITDVIRLAQKQESSCLSAHAFINGQFLCVQKDSKGIIIVSADGEPKGEFASDLKAPTAVHSGKQMVAILQKNTLHTYNHDGSKIYAIGQFGSSAGGFDRPSFVFTAHNQVYVADSGNNRVQIFARDGQFVGQVKGGTEHSFEKVGPIVVDRQKNLYVADLAGKRRIHMFSPDLMKMISIGNRKTSIHNTKKTYALDIDQQDRLYALVSSKTNNYSIRLYNQLGKLTEFGSGHENGSDLYFSSPATLSVVSDNKNSIFINDNKLNSLFRFDYHEIPDAAFGLRVKANKDRVQLHWHSSKSPLIERYLIQTAANAKGPFQTIAETTELSKTFRYVESLSLPWYRIQAISSLGLAARATLPRQNQYYRLDRLYHSKQYKEVIKLADRILKFDADNADSLHLKAQSQLETGQQQAAIISFRRLEQYPGYKNLAIQQQIRTFYELEQYLDAKSLINQMMALSPEDVDPYLICAELSIQLGDAVGAVTCAEDGLALHGAHTRLRYLLGKSYILAGLMDKGRAEYQQVIELEPGNAAIRLSIAEHYMQMQEYLQALEQFEAVSQIKQEVAQAWIGQANALLKLNRDDEAKAIAIKLSTNKASQGEGYYVLGKIAAKQKKYSEAVLRLTRASKVKPENIDIWLSLADAYTRLDQIPAALKSLDQAVEANSESFDLNLLAGRLELEQENYSKAHPFLDKAVHLNPQALAANKLFAKNLIATRNFHSAENYAFQAARLAPKDIDVLILQADIASHQGKVGSAIEYLKTAINLNPASAQLQYQLGKVYQNTNLFDSSREHLEKAAAINPVWAAPHVALGQLYGKRRLFDEAISSLEKAVELEPSDHHRAILNSAFADKKKSLEFKTNTPQLVLSDLNLKHVFSAAYKKYAEQSIGSVTLKNAGGTDYGNLQLSFQIKEYMDFPVTQEIPSIKGNESLQFDFKVTFNNKILEVDEDIGVQVEVKLSFSRDGRNDSIYLTQPMTIYGKNAMVWGDSEMVGSFVTPKDDTLRNYVRRVINEFQPEPGPLNEKLVAAMTFFSSLTAAGTKYVIDPNTPYTSLRDDQVDYVQFPRETLKLKSGDCDDLSVLISAGLENLGIETAFVEIPGHLLMMFNTGLAESEMGLISQDSSLLVIRNGQVWIPIESTMVNASFTEAWAEGARKYQQALTDNNLGIIDLKQAWQQYKPVTLRKAGYSIEIPGRNRADELINTAQNQLLSKSINRLILPYQSMIASNPQNIQAHMQIAILFSRYGLYDDAQLSFDALNEIAPDDSAVHTNQGNLYLLQKFYDKAIASYQQAAKLDPTDGGIWLNMSMARYRKGDLKAAAKDFQTAISKSPALASSHAAYSKLLSQ